MNIRKMFELLIDYPLDDALAECISSSAEHAVHKIDAIIGDDYLGWRRWIDVSLQIETFRLEMKQ